MSSRCAPWQDPGAQLRVLAHLGPLVLVERTGLLEDGVGDPDLADVVQHAGEVHALDLVGAHAHLGRDRTRVATDELRVPGGAGVAHVKRLGEHEHRGEVALLDSGLTRLLAEQAGGDLAVEDHGAVAAERLRREHRAVGAGQELLGGGAVLGIARDAERDRQPVLGERFPHLAAQPVRQHVRPVFVRVRRDQRELLPADPSSDVDPPLAFLEDRPDRLERPVRSRDAVLLVELPEAVDVYGDDADRTVAAARALQLELSDLLEAAAVQQAGVRVGPGGVREAADQLPHAHAHRPDHPRGEGDRRDRAEPCLDRAFLAPHDKPVGGSDERDLCRCPPAVQEVAGLEADGDVEDGPGAPAGIAEELDRVGDEDRRERERGRRGPRRQAVLGAEA